jgi:hypothetical protein
VISEQKEEKLSDARFCRTEYKLHGLAVKGHLPVWWMSEITQPQRRYVAKQ